MEVHCGCGDGLGTKNLSRHVLDTVASYGKHTRWFDIRWWAKCDEGSGGAGSINLELWNSK